MPSLCLPVAQFEICFACGDDGFTLARSLGLDPDKVASLPGFSTAIRLNMHPQAEDVDRVQIAREHAAAIALYKGKSSKEVEMY